MLELLEATGELDNTLIIITSDNGMAFPYAKANCTEFGIHMPLAVSWKKEFPAGRKVDDVVSLVDVSATIYKATGIQAPEAFPVTGRSLLDMLKSDKTVVQEKGKWAAFAARERHSSSRFNSLGYPQRCIRVQKYLLIKNLRPERWPAGPSRKLSGKPGSKLGPEDAAYHDIDACPTLSFLIANKGKPSISKFFDLAVGKRPAVELYDIEKDPGCLNNLAEDPSLAAIRDNLSEALKLYMEVNNDPRADKDPKVGDIFETYKRYSGIRWFPEPDWAKENPESVPDQPWLNPDLKKK